MKKIYIIQTLLLSIFLAGCNSTEYYEFENTQVKIESAEIHFTATGGTGEIIVAESGNFTATSDQNWCSLSINGKVITITATPNMSISGRSARITVKSGNKVNYVSVTQTSVTFNIDATNISIDGKRGEAHITYQTEASVAIDTVTNSWLTVSIDGNEIVLQAAANPDLENTRSATVTLVIRNENTNLFKYNLNVTQEKNYLNYEDYLGTYTMDYSIAYANPTPTRSLTVTLSVKSETDKTYYLEGILTDALAQYGNITAKYNADGTLSILGQIMFPYPNNTAYDTWLLPYSEDAYVSRSTTYGMISADTDLSNGGLKFKMVDNGVWGTRKTAGFLLRVYNGSTSIGNLAGQDGQPYYFYPSFEKQ
ncbi:MAG: hypothetical protein LBE11_08320 [Prevotellaceae bacterium]|jgi:heat shock protein HslJ|nr:hypothetical protein [Prevotellaceae bacterium]